jgi:N-acetylmuramoyl-L-alanine amidase
MRHKMHHMRSPHSGERQEEIDFLIIHYTECDLETALKIFTNPDPQGAVSAHYVIAEDGQIFQLVDEERVAWHAGKSYWEGRQSLNQSSIGIELVNPGHGPQYRPFAVPQMEALIDLSQAIVKRHPIPSKYVLGHSDIAPQRKKDPGELFNWQTLADHGIGISLKSLESSEEKISPLSTPDALRLLSSIGYDAPPEISESQFFNLIRAFQMHFYPRGVTGALCSETCARLIRLQKQMAEISRL